MEDPHELHRHHGSVCERVRIGDGITMSNILSTALPVIRATLPTLAVGAGIGVAAGAVASRVDGSGKLSAGLAGGGAVTALGMGIGAATMLRSGTMPASAILGWGLAFGAVGVGGITAGILGQRLLS